MTFCISTLFLCHCVIVEFALFDLFVGQFLRHAYIFSPYLNQGFCIRRDIVVHAISSTYSSCDTKIHLGKFKKKKKK